MYCDVFILGSAIGFAAKGSEEFFFCEIINFAEAQINKAETRIKITNKEQEGENENNNVYLVCYLDHGGCRIGFGDIFLRDKVRGHWGNHGK